MLTAPVPKRGALLQVRRREEARTEWINRVITAQEDERRRISAELHDEVIQSLALLHRELDLLEESSEPGSVKDGLEAARQVEALEAGAKGYLLKTVRAAEVVQAIRQCRAARPFCSRP